MNARDRGGSERRAIEREGLKGVRVRDGGEGRERKREREMLLYVRISFHIFHCNFQCYAVDGATKSRQNVGYVMLDLRTAHPKSKQVHTCTFT